MKNLQRGFITPFILAIIALLVLGSGAYVYIRDKQTNQPVVVSPTTQATSTGQTSSSKNMKFSASPFTETNSLSVWFFASLSDGTTDNKMYSVDFGDRSIDPMNWDNGKGTNNGWGLSVSHTYVTAGTYIATLKTIPSPPCPASQGIDRRYCDSVTIATVNVTVPLNRTAPPSSQTDGWKTYANSKYGYEFKYPDTLKLVQGTTDGSNGVTLNKSGTVEFGTLYPSFEVIIDPQSAGFGGASDDVKIDGYLFSKTIVQRNANDLPDYVTICNKSGYRGFTVERNLVLFKGFNSLSIRGMVCQNDVALLPTFEEILSTFRYTANAEIPNGKIYQNNTFGYKVEIPQSWFVDESKVDAVIVSPDSSQSKYLGVISVTSNISSETLGSLRKQTPSLNEDMLVGGQKAIRGILDFEGAGSYYVVKLIYQDKIYTLDRRIATPEIFSTFKFTK